MTEIINLAQFPAYDNQRVCFHLESVNKRVKALVFHACPTHQAHQQHYWKINRVLSTL